MWFLPLAITQSEDGSCVAGLGDDGKWYRPEPISLEQVSGETAAFSYDHWRLLRLGPKETSAPPENRALVAFDPALPRPARAKQRLDMLAQMASPSVYSAFADGQSLGCIRATVHDIYFRRHTGGRRFLRIVFSDPAGERFDWVLPELAMNQRWAAEGGLDVPDDRRDRLLTSMGTDAYLTLALGDKNDRFPGKYDGRHPLVVGVHPVTRHQAPAARDQYPPLFWLMSGKIGSALMALHRLGVLQQLTVPTGLTRLCEIFGLNAAQAGPLLDVLSKAGFVSWHKDGWRLTQEGRILLPMIDTEARLSAHRDPEAFVLGGLTGQSDDPLDTIDDQRFFESYSASMQRNARPLAMGILRFVRPARGERLVDLGGADGSLAAELLGLVDGFETVVVDRAAMAPQFEALRAEKALNDRTQFHVQDLRTSFNAPDVLAKADIVTMCNLLHLLSKSGMDTLFATLRATRPGTRCVIYDLFPDPAGPLSISDLLMVDWVSIGSDFPADAAQLYARLNRAGFVDIQTEKLPVLPGTFILFRNGVAE